MKVQDLIEEMDPLFPADFFTCQVKIGKTLTVLPDVSDLLAEESFGSLALSWSPEGITGLLSVKRPLEASFFPEYTKGDAFELFIDTRNNKKAGFVNRFCHKFVFLGQEANEVRALEMTKFRSEDAHPLCDSEDIIQQVKKKKDGYEIAFTLPGGILHGYDPTQFSELGLAYRIHGFKGKPQNFPFSGRYTDPLQHPSLWASLLLI